MSDRTLTVADVLRMRPCGMDDDGYTPARVKELWAGRESLTLLDVLDLDIPIADRLWCVLHAVDRRTRVLLACDYAGHVLPIWEARHPDDMRPRATLETCHRWLDGEATDDELIAVARAAYTSAAHAAAACAAYAYAYAATAYAAAASAASAAFSDTNTTDDELEWQLARTREVLAIEED